MGGAEVYLFQHEKNPVGGIGPYRQFGPYCSDAEGRARCPTALTYDGARFDRFAYGRLPGQLVGVARATYWGPARDEQAPIRLILCPSHKVRGTVSVPDGFDARSVRVRVLSFGVFSGKYSVAESFPREGFRLGLALPDLFEADVNQHGEFALGDLPTEGRYYLAAEGAGLGQGQYNTVMARELDGLVYELRRTR